MDVLSRQLPLTPQWEVHCGNWVWLSRVSWALQKPLPPLWPGHSPFLTGEGLRLRAKQQAPRADSFLAERMSFCKTEKPSHSPSCCWLAGVQVPGPAPQTACPAHSLPGVGRKARPRGVGRLSFLLREEPLELLPVSWSGLPPRMP